MPMANRDRPTDDKISLTFISQRLDDVLEQMRMITDEITEMKDREGHEHGDN